MVRDELWVKSVLLQLWPTAELWITFIVASGAIAFVLVNSERTERDARMSLSVKLNGPPHVFIDAQRSAGVICGNYQVNGQSGRFLYIDPLSTKDEIVKGLLIEGNPNFKVSTGRLCG